MTAPVTPAGTGAEGLAANMIPATARPEGIRQMQSVTLNILPDRALLLWETPTSVEVLAEYPSGQLEPIALRRLRIDASHALHRDGIGAVRALIASRPTSPDRAEGGDK